MKFLLESMAHLLADTTLTEEQQNALKQQIPMGRIGEADEVAKVILFLASDLASYVTGQVIHITGGLGM